ncbi:hypothetical protein AVEN_121161-1 [Araneus ventricosus]|uniref:Uncharacterized protein n=1 Tax=Araneus ventricosus TaxID=182803 RepID=A0A4Y2DZQ3_ARAVE|nr:hypothetical protein AVEN_121161-1 [Araneus ventricosus]
MMTRPQMYHKILLAICPFIAPRAGFSSLICRRKNNMLRILLGAFISDTYRSFSNASHRRSANNKLRGACSEGPMSKTGQGDQHGRSEVILTLCLWVKKFKSLIDVVVERSDMAKRVVLGRGILLCCQDDGGSSVAFYLKE